MATDKWISENQDRMRAYRREWYRRNREKSILKASERTKQIKVWFAEIKSKLKCERCGENHPATLDFHHVDEAEKEIEVSAAVFRGNKKKILAEIEKCIVLCANCHRKHHYNERK